MGIYAATMRNKIRKSKFHNKQRSGNDETVLQEAQLSLRQPTILMATLNFFFFWGGGGETSKALFWENKCL